jgi:hypothetical protein
MICPSTKSSTRRYPTRVPGGREDQRCIASSTRYSVDSGHSHPATPAGRRQSGSPSARSGSRVDGSDRTDDSAAETGCPRRRIRIPSAHDASRTWCKQSIPRRQIIGWPVKPIYEKKVHLVITQRSIPDGRQSRSVRPGVTIRGIVVADGVSRRSSIIAASTTCEQPESSYLHQVDVFPSLKGCANPTCAFNVIYVIRGLHTSSPRHAAERRSKSLIHQHLGCVSQKSYRN